MGKALITSGGTAGSYTVKAVHFRDRIEAEITWLESMIEEIRPVLEDLEDDLDLAQLEVDEARILIEAIINDWAREGEVVP